MSAMADFTERDGALRFSGSLTLARIGDLPERLRAADGGVATLDLSGIEHIDTVGAWLIHRFAAEQSAIVLHQHFGIEFEMEGEEES